MPFNDIERLASAVAHRLVSPTHTMAASGTASPGIERLVSAVARRLASPADAAKVASYKADVHVFASRLATRVASRSEARVTPAIDLGAMDVAKLASAVTRRIVSLKEKSLEPIDVVASITVQKLSAPTMFSVGGTIDPGLEQRVASAVVSYLNVGKTESSERVPTGQKAADKPTK